MINKEAIIDNVSQYTAEELVKFISSGIVTLDELVSGNPDDFSPTKRRDVKHLLESGDDDEWERVQKEPTIEAAQRYLDGYQDGKYRNEAREMIKELSERKNEQEKRAKTEDAWGSVDKGSIDSLSSFCKEYPGSPYVQEARKLINDILLGQIIREDISTLVYKIKQIQTSVFDVDHRTNSVIREITEYINAGKVTKADFLNALCDDYNLVSAGVVKQLVEGQVLDCSDLKNIGIDDNFIRKMMEGAGLQSFSSPERLDRIHKQSTEIYFWGIPSSGKSCALGAILSVAASGRVAHSMDNDIDSQGYGYMTQLINLFDTTQEGSVVPLMAGTNVSDFYEMGFDLIDEKGCIHPITCIDMAGELMRCMYKSNARMNLDEDQNYMLDTLHRVLVDNRTTNRKMHIFVIEYGAEDRQYEGLPQRTYLDGAVSYIQNTGIFRKDTDAIFIMITKADKAKNATIETFSNYIKDKYQGFYNGLERICKDNGINRGRVEKIAFSLGEVRFQNYCRFNPRSAENVVRIILERSASQKGGKIGKLFKKFRS